MSIPRGPSSHFRALSALGARVWDAVVQVCLAVFSGAPLPVYVLSMIYAVGRLRQVSAVDCTEDKAVSTATVVLPT